MDEPNLNSLELRIGMLRQWLNEDRITDSKKLVTNEDIHHWLDKGIAHQCTEARIDEVDTLGKKYLIDPNDARDRIKGLSAQLIREETK